MAAIAGEDSHVICAIYFHTPDKTNDFVGTKLKIQVPIEYKDKDGKEGKHFLLRNFIQHLNDYCDIIRESEERGLGKSVDIKVARIDKKGPSISTYNIPTQQAWEREHKTELISSGTSLQVNVTRKVVYFEKNQPVIKLTSTPGTNDGGKQVTTKTKKRKPTKRGLDLEEDKTLIKRLKDGKDPERNPRQQNLLEDLKKAGAECGTVLNEYQIECKRCTHTIQFRVDTSNPKTKLSHFKKYHYDGCTGTSRQDDDAKRRMSGFMQTYFKPDKPPVTAQASTSAANDDIDSDREAPDHDSDRDAKEFDSDMEVEEEIPVKDDSSCCSEDVDMIPSDTTSNSESESEMDPQYIIFPVTFKQADPVCIRLNSLIESGKIPKDKIFYKYLNDMTSIFIDRQHKYDKDVVEFFNTIKYLGGERTANFVRGPMYIGTGKGSKKDNEEAKMNLGGPSRRTMQKASPGYTTSSGIVKPWLQSILTLANDEKSSCVPLVDNDVLKVFPGCLQNDGTPLKPSILFDDQQNVCIGLQDKCDIQFVRANPEPDPTFLRENVVTEANVDYVTTLDNNLSLPIGAHYKPKAGKTGAELKGQFLEDVRLIQTCLRCLKRTECPEQVLCASSCDSMCAECIQSKKACDECTDLKQISHIPCLRACKQCISSQEKCIRLTILVVSADSESGNKNAFESILEARKEGTLPVEFIFLPVPDGLHAGKSLKGSPSNWIIVLKKQRACLSMLRTLRDADPELKRIIPRDSVIHKDRMDYNCILHLSKPSSLEYFGAVDYIVHTIVPDKYKPSDSNKVGMYPHPVAIDISSDGRLYALNYKPLAKLSTLLKIRLHVPADITVLKEIGEAHSLVYSNGVVYVCELNKAIHVVPTSKIVRINPSKIRTKDELKDLLSGFNLNNDGTKAELCDRLQIHLDKQEQIYLQKGDDLATVLLSENIKPSCIGKLSDDGLIIASDMSRTLYIASLEFDGVAVLGQLQPVCPYLTIFVTVKSTCLLKDNCMLVSFCSESGSGLAKVCLETSTASILIADDNHIISAGVSSIDNDQVEAVYCDPHTHTIKALHPDGTIHIMTGNGKEGNNDGKAVHAEFGQPMDLCTEYEENIYITDAQTGCIKIITKITGITEFFKHLGLLYESFSVHLKNQDKPSIDIDDAVAKLEQVAKYIADTSKCIQDQLGKPVTNGPEGTVADRTLKSVQMIASGISALVKLISEINPDYKIDLHSCLTMDVENLHAVGHYKEQIPTMLHHIRNLATSVYESLKRVVPWSAYYYTKPQSYYPVPEHNMKLADLPKLKSSKQHTDLTVNEIEEMRSWAADHGKCVKQRTIRQETTKYKCGTLPLNMYQQKQKPVSEMEKVQIPLDGQIESSSTPISASAPSGSAENESSSESEFEQLSEYDSDSEIGDLDDADIEPLSRISQRSGRAIRLPLRFRDQ